MCDQLDHEQETCTHLLKVIKEGNGRCSYHEELTKGLSKVTGRVDIILIIQTILAGLIVAHMYGGA